MRIDSPIPPFGSGAYALHSHTLQEADGETMFPLSTVGASGASEDKARQPGDRFEPSKGGMALLGAEKLLGAEEALPGQGSAEDCGAEAARIEGAEIPDLQEAPSEWANLHGSSGSAVSAKGPEEEGRGPMAHSILEAAYWVRLAGP